MKGLNLLPQWFHLLSTCYWSKTVDSLTKQSSNFIRIQFHEIVTTIQMRSWSCFRDGGPKWECLPIGECNWRHITHENSMDQNATLNSWVVQRWSIFTNENTFQLTSAWKWSGFFRIYSTFLRNNTRWSEILKGFSNSSSITVHSPKFGDRTTVPIRGSSRNRVNLSQIIRSREYKTKFYILNTLSLCLQK